MYVEYITSFHKADILRILKAEDDCKHYPININFILLFDQQPNIVKELLNEPEKCIKELDSACTRAQLDLLQEADSKSKFKINVHCRIYQFPCLSGVTRFVFPRNHDAGKFLQISGTVMRITAVKLLEYQRNFVCMKCKKPVLVKAEYDRKYMIKQPKKCENPDGCDSTNLLNLGELDSGNCKDYQEIKIQELVNKLGVGSIPDTMWVTLEDDLVDSCKPGDNVTICGILKRRWGEFCKGKKIDIDLALKANNVQVDNNASSSILSTPEVKEMFDSFWEKYANNNLEGRDVILRSFCPQIYGLYLVKLAVAVVLAGGCQTEDGLLTGVHTRAEPHLLLVGDPGTGKSHLLRFASKIIPRSVLTTGIGSTAAGLTVTAVMEHGEWQLEAGALVMSDGGICCIDEFNSMKEHDRTSIHEAMEQQTISVAKASIVCKLNTRCSILAACNPKGNIDPSQPLCMSIALPSPLLSRFDLILMLRDTVNDEWDSQVADYILNGGSNFSKLTDAGQWNIEMLQSYYMRIKKFKPKLTDDAEMILSRYYQMQRRIDSRNKARTTVRLLESLVRLSQGHARLMYHENVEVVDSIYAIILVDAAMERESSIFNFNINTNSVFPERPLNDYREIIEVILDKLQLPRILEKEMALVMKQINGGVQSRFFHNQGDGNDNDNDGAPYEYTSNRDNQNDPKENIWNKPAVNQINTFNSHFKDLTNLKLNESGHQEAKKIKRFSIEGNSVSKTDKVSTSEVASTSTEINDSVVAEDNRYNITSPQVVMKESTSHTSKQMQYLDHLQEVSTSTNTSFKMASNVNCCEDAEMNVPLKTTDHKDIISVEAKDREIAGTSKQRSQRSKGSRLSTTEDSGFDDFNYSQLLTNSLNSLKDNVHSKTKLLLKPSNQKNHNNVDKTNIFEDFVSNIEIDTFAETNSHDKVAKSGKTCTKDNKNGSNIAQHSGFNDILNSHLSFNHSLLSTRKEAKLETNNLTTSVEPLGSSSKVRPSLKKFKYISKNKDETIGRDKSVQNIDSFTTSTRDNIEDNTKNSSSDFREKCKDSNKVKGTLDAQTSRDKNTNKQNLTNDNELIKVCLDGCYSTIDCKNKSKPNNEIALQVDLNLNKPKRARKINKSDDDLELLKYMPGINDKFKFDMNIDWECCSEPSNISTTSSTSALSKMLTDFKDLSHDNIAKRKFSSKASSERNLSSNIGNKSMFESADDDLDFEL